MNIKTLTKKILTTASIYFTVITAIYTLLVMIVNVTEDEILLSAEQLLFNFLFSILAAIAWLLYRSKSMAGALRLVLHFGITAISFYLCFLLPAGMTAAQVFIGLFAYAIVYFLIVGITAFFKARFRANAEQEAPYENRYKK